MVASPYIEVVVGLSDSSGDGETCTPYDDGIHTQLGLTAGGAASRPSASSVTSTISVESARTIVSLGKLSVLLVPPTPPPHP